MLEKSYFAISDIYGTNSDNHPDITLFDSETGQNLDVDVSLAYPWSQDILKRASKEDGYAARTKGK